MSRIGKLPITIPDAIKVSIEDKNVIVEGKRGRLIQEIRGNIQVEIIDGKVILTRKFEDKKSKSFHGLYRSLIANMIRGVNEGYSKSLVINGVGYRVEQKDTSLIFSLGYSTPFEYIVPQGITVKLDGNTKLIVEGANKAQVGQVSAEIRSLRAPEPYKGKGIKYENETLRRKVGKSGVK